MGGIAKSPEGSFFPAIREPPRGCDLGSSGVDRCTPPAPLRIPGRTYRHGRPQVRPQVVVVTTEIEVGGGRDVLSLES